jgi:uncharacterized membrane protein YbhN (UPF0104 family)
MAVIQDDGNEFLTVLQPLQVVLGVFLAAVGVLPLMSQTARNRLRNQPWRPSRPEQAWPGWFQAAYPFLVSVLVLIVGGLMMGLGLGAFHLTVR